MPLPRGLVSSLASLLLPAALLAQSASTPWPPVARAELELKENTLSPGSPALILERRIHTDDEERYRIVYFRIKIFSQQGMEHADVEIPYWEKQNVVEDIRGRTTRADGKVVEFSGTVFDRVVAKSRKLKLQMKSFTLNGVEPGAVIEYGYKQRWREKWDDAIRHPKDYVFTGVSSYPTEKWVINAKIPVRYAKWTLRPVNRELLEWAIVNLPEGTRPQQPPGGDYVLEVRNVKPFVVEPLMLPESVLESRLHFYYILGGPRWEQGFWHQVGKQSGEFFDKFIGKSKAIQREVQRLIAPGDPAETKLRKIYKRVQQIRNLSYEAEKTQAEEKKLKENKDAEDVLVRGFGRGNELNLLFTAMARAAGFQAVPTMVTPRDQDAFRPNVLDPGQLTAMVVWVELDGSHRFFDPATKYCPFDLLPWEETSVRGVLMHPNGGRMVQTADPKSGSAVIERRGTLKVGADGSLQGTMEVVFSGHEALTRRLDWNEKDESGRRQALKDEILGWLQPGSEVELTQEPAWQDGDRALEAKLSLRVPQFATVTGKRLMLPGAVFSGRREYPLQSAERVNTIYYRFPTQEKDAITLELPEGFQVVSVPPPRNPGPNQAAWLQSSYRRTGDRTLLFVREIGIASLGFAVDVYPSVRKFYQSIRTSDEEQVLLQVETVAAGSEPR